MGAIRVSETSILRVSMCGDNRLGKIAYGVLDYNPVEKTTEKISYCYVNTENNKITHNLGGLYDDTVITKVVKKIMETHSSFIEIMNTIPKSQYITDGELNRLQDGRTWSEIKHPVELF